MSSSIKASALSVGELPQDTNRNIINKIEMQTFFIFHPPANSPSWLTN